MARIVTDKLFARWVSLLGERLPLIYRLLNLVRWLTSRFPFTHFHLSNLAYQRIHERLDLLFNLVL
jgi:hypothetical protein